MAVLVRGSVSDRPWGMTLGALGNRALTGQLTLSADGKQYRVAFERGAVVGAHSPMVTDAAVRLALTGNLVTSSQISELTRRIAAAPDRDEVDVIAEMCRLGPDQAQRLRRRLVAQRAARTFSVEQGQFVVDDVIDIAVVAGGALDVRAVIYLGARTNLTDERLDAELAQLGAWFKLKSEAIDDLPQYGFAEDAKPILHVLVAGANLADVEAAVPEAGARGVRAVVYALVSCGACEVSATPRAGRGAPATGQPASRTRSASVPPQHARTSTVSSSSSPAQPRTATSRSPTTGSHAAYPAPSRTSTTGSQAAAYPAPDRTRTPTPQQPATPRTLSQSALPTSRTRTGSGSGALRLPGGGTVPSLSRARTSSVAPPMSMTSVRAPLPSARPTRRPRQNTAATLEIESILQKKIPLLDRGVDHFTLLGLPVGASPEDVRQTYFMLARKLHPDRLSAIGLDDNHRHAQRLMASINEAFAVLNDPGRHDEYMAILGRGGEEAVRAEEAKADELAMRVMRAEEAFRQGEMALRREQIAQAVQSFTTAVELAPNEPEYQAMLAWAKFAASSDKHTVAIQTRKALLRAADANEDSTTARFYLGRVERMLGREKEALHHFLEVLRIKPNHAEASSEARVLEQRLKSRR